MSTRSVADGGALAPFRVRSYRFQWPADLSSSWAFEMEALILGWYVLVETRSVSLLALFGALQYLGSLLAPLFGVAGDRLGHRTLMCAIRTIYLLLAAASTALAFAGLLTPSYVFAIATLGGLMRSSDLAARNALVAQTIPAASLTGALGLSRSTSDSARLAGSLAGASLAATLGLGPAYVAVTAFYALSVLLSFQVAGRPARAHPAAHRPWQDLREGLVYTWRSPAVLGALSIAFLVNLFAFPFVFGLLPYVAKEIYRTDQIGLGYLVASFALGGTIGSLLVGLQQARLPAARAMLVATLLWFVSVCAFGWVSDLGAGIALLLLTGILQSICVAPLAAVMLKGCDEAMRGRVMGLRMLAIWGLPLGLLIAGPMISGLGFALTATGYGLAGLALTLWTAVHWRAHLWRAGAPANH